MKNIFFFSILCASISLSQYSLNVEHIGGAKRAGEENLFRATLVKDGNAINTVERKIPFDVPFPAYYLNEITGIFVLSNAFDGFVEVYSSQGIKKWEQNFFKGMGPNYERTISVALGETTIAFLTSDVTLPNAIVHRYKNDGVKEWETILPFSMGSEIAMSDDEQTIVAGSYFVLLDEVRQSSAVIGRNGKIEGSANIVFRRVAFSENNEFIALTSEREISVYSNETKKEIGRTNKKTDGIITDVLWNGSTLIVQESEVKATPEYSFFYANPTFISYTKELAEQRRQRIELPSFKISRLRKFGKDVQFNFNGTNIILNDLK